MSASSDVVSYPNIDEKLKSGLLAEAGDGAESVTSADDNHDDDDSDPAASLDGDEGDSNSASSPDEDEDEDEDLTSAASSGSEESFSDTEFRGRKSREQKAKEKAKKSADTLTKVVGARVTQRGTTVFLPLVPKPGLNRVVVSVPLTSLRLTTKDNAAVKQNESYPKWLQWKKFDPKEDKKAEIFFPKKDKIINIVCKVAPKRAMNEGPAVLRATDRIYGWVNNADRKLKGLLMTTPNQLGRLGSKYVRMIEDAAVARGFRNEIEPLTKQGVSSSKIEKWGQTSSPAELATLYLRLTDMVDPNVVRDLMRKRDSRLGKDLRGKMRHQSDGPGIMSEMKGSKGHRAKERTRTTANVDPEVDTEQETDIETDDEAYMNAKNDEDATLVAQDAKLGKPPSRKKLEQIAAMHDAEAKKVKKEEKEYQAEKAAAGKTTKKKASTKSLTEKGTDEKKKKTRASSDKGIQKEKQSDVPEDNKKTKATAKVKKTKGSANADSTKVTGFRANPARNKGKLPSLKGMA